MDYVDDEYAKHNDEYAKQQHRQNNGLPCSHCGAHQGHFSFCVLLNTPYAQIMREHGYTSTDGIVWRHKDESWDGDDNDNLYELSMSDVLFGSNDDRPRADSESFYCKAFRQKDLKDQVPKFDKPDTDWLKAMGITL
jgi:hypothetical protein